MYCTLTCNLWCCLHPRIADMAAHPGYWPNRKCKPTIQHKVAVFLSVFSKCFSVVTLNYIKYVAGYIVKVVKTECSVSLGNDWLFWIDSVQWIGIWAWVIWSGSSLNDSLTQLISFIGGRDFYSSQRLKSFESFDTFSSTLNYASRWLQAFACLSESFTHSKTKVTEKQASNYPLLK